MIVIPYLAGMLHADTERWGAEHGAVLKRIRYGDDEGYWRLLSTLWKESGDLLIVEQDMLPSPHVTDRMARCRRPWCVSPFQVDGGAWAQEALGCTKFAARLKSRHPDLMVELGESTAYGDAPKLWHRLDIRLALLMRELGYRPHIHKRSVHLHNYADDPRYREG